MLGLGAAFSSTITFCTPFRGDSAIGLDPIDASAGETADGGAGSFCVRARAERANVLLCDDFERGVLIAEWATQSVPDAGIVTIESSNPTDVLYTRLEPDLSGCNYARAVRMGAADVSHLRVEFDVRVGEPGSPIDDSIAYFALYFDLPPPGCGLILAHDGSMAFVNEQIPDGDGGTINEVHSLTVLPSHDAWVHVMLDVDRTSGNLRVEIDHQLALVPEVTLKPTCRGAGRATVEVGLHCQSTPGRAKAVRYDNVIVTEVP
jgi:hypothetical protein